MAAVRICSRGTLGQFCGSPVRSDAIVAAVILGTVTAGTILFYFMSSEDTSRQFYLWGGIGLLAIEVILVLAIVGVLPS